MVDPKKRLLRNVTSNWVQMAVYTVIALMLTPYLVHSLGKEAYGIWALIFSIISYTRFFDVGFRQSLARYLPKYYATGDYNKLNEVVNSSNVIYLISGTLVIITTIVIATFFIGVFKVSPEYHDIMRTAMIIMGVNQAMYFFLMSGTALGPFHRYDLMNAIEIGRTIVGTILVVWLLYSGYGLVALALTTLMTNFAAQLAKRYCQHRIVPQITFSFKFVTRERIRELFDYGIVSFLIVVAWIVIYSTDNIVVGAFISTTAVTFYNIAGTIINSLRSVVSSIGIPLVPAISHLGATSDMKEIAALNNKLVRYLYYLTTAACIGIAFYGSAFVGLWMGEGFESTVHVLLILIGSAWIYLPQTMSSSVLMGIGKHPTLLYILIVEAISNIVLSLILVQFWGLYGVALGTAIPQVVIYSYFFPRAFYRKIDTPLGDFYKSSGKAIAYSIAISLPVTWATATFIPLGGWFGFAVKVLTVIAVVGAGFLWRILDANDRGRLLRPLGLGRA